MKKIASLLFVSILGGILTLGSYKIFFDDENNPVITQDSTSQHSFIPVSNAPAYGTNADFTAAAEKTVHAVVHVKNVAVFKGPRSMWDLYNNGTAGGRAVQGAGSGVIITPDGYIVTNNHVVDGASEIEVTLNNNETYKAEVIGADPISEIALIKVDANEDLEYIPFGNSDNVKLGEWVLAVGNPFNLKSTVTAGIISAKARNLDPYDRSPQSFIQTDAAINPGNSGGALVNINGELIGINTAITSPSGSYIGYAFAVPSNNARKIVEDIMEYGNVQQGILGIRGGSVDPQTMSELNLKTSQGVLVGDVTSGSGAEQAGIRQNDVIRQIDNVKINKFSDLTGYINTKRPGDQVMVKLDRDGQSKEFRVTLSKRDSYQIPSIGLEVANATSKELKSIGTSYGVKINNTLNENLPKEELVGTIITEINNESVSNIREVEDILEKRRSGDPIVITYIDRSGRKQRMIWR
ncbi:MAG: trypsin-like peptidase domain-containing protein [Bacteroidota bacterium]|nr:trypsin-like peptidase domain-containing protein [Bacteroidota bacterium]